MGTEVGRQDYRGGGSGGGQRAGGIGGGPGEE